MAQYRKVSIRTVNAFLRKKGIDPIELHKVITNTGAKLGRKDVVKITTLLDAAKRVLVYVKGQKLLIRDADKKFNFDDPVQRQLAVEKRRAMSSNGSHPLPA